MNKNTYSDLMIRIQKLRRRVDDANRALVTGKMISLTQFPEEVQDLTHLAKELPEDRYQQAIFALNTLDADINSYTRILNMWQHQHVETPMQAFG